MKYIFLLIACFTIFIAFSLLPAGKAISTVFIIFIVGVFLFITVSYNKVRDEADREQYQDKDKPYFKQQISSNRDHGNPSPRWMVWLGVLAFPIIYGIVVFFTK